MLHKIDEILTFWFGRVPGPTFGLRDNLVLPTRIPYWGGHWAERLLDVDGIIRRRFGEDMRKAAAGELDHWAQTPKGRLALILVLDQFPRNAVRETPAAFDQDAKALSLALEALRKGEDRRFHPLARGYFYLPLMHHETLEMQDRCLGLLLSAWSEAPGLARIVLTADLASGLRHRAIIARFGRFPHRNKILERESTAEEKAFLEEPFSSF